MFVCLFVCLLLFVVVVVVLFLFVCLFVSRGCLVCSFPFFVVVIINDISGSSGIWLMCL